MVCSADLGIKSEENFRAFGSDDVVLLVAEAFVSKCCIHAGNSVFSYLNCLRFYWALLNLHAGWKYHGACVLLSDENHSIIQ